VQVLFAFLLTVPFTQRFTELTRFQEKVYYATLLAAAFATVLLIAPSAHHRVLFREGDKRFIVFLATRLTLAGLAFLALAMSGVIFLITDVLYSRGFAVAMLAAAVGTFALFWYVIPLARRVMRNQ
jgi:hypothetical protein